MTWAMYGDRPNLSSRRFLNQLCSETQIMDLIAWKNGFFEHVNGKVSYVRGTVFHIWHGTTGNRTYLERHKILKDYAFDPKIDIRIDENGCWAWNSDKPKLRQMIREYFLNRREDPPPDSAQSGV